MRTTPPPRRHEAAIRHEVNTAQAQRALAQLAYTFARSNFWYYRIVMNPRLTLRDIVVSTYARGQAAHVLGMTSRPARNL